MSGRRGAEVPPWPGRTVPSLTDRRIKGAVIADQGHRRPRRLDPAAGRRTKAAPMLRPGGGVSGVLVKGCFRARGGRRTGRHWPELNCGDLS
ncbi:hypothetical protein GCM10010433_49230 [Streptomyces pulveraceus]